MRTRNLYILADSPPNCLAVAYDLSDITSCYTPSVGRWLRVDPLADKYPGLSPYNYVPRNRSAK